MAPSIRARRVLVTGGARGIGAAIVHELVDQGYIVDFTFNASAEPARELEHEILARHPRAVLRPRICNLADADAVELLAHDLEQVEAGYYGFVHNAGTTYDSLSALVDLETAERVMQVNFWSMVRLLQAVTRGMTSRGEGRIVLIGSLTALRGARGNAPYAASKAAMLGYMRSVVEEVARKGVTANYVAPGFIDTDMLEPYAAQRATLEPQIPAGRYGRPEEVAAAVGFLLSERAAYINGATLEIDGGLGATLAAQP
jgi:3-oxoacyl-[acyl-carrier protein] reductase